MSHNKHAPCKAGSERILLGWAALINTFLVTRNIQEFLKLTEFAERGSIKEKLAWTFKLYDKDMSGGGNTFLVDNEGWPYVTRNHNCQRNAGGDRDSDYHGGA